MILSVEDSIYILGNQKLEFKKKTNGSCDLHISQYGKTYSHYNVDCNAECFFHLYENAIENNKSGIYLFKKLFNEETK